MQSFIDFLVNNYLWFLVISLILVFALIGYLVDTSEKKVEKKIEERPIEEKKEIVVNLSQDSQATEVLDDKK